MISRVAADGRLDLGGPFQPLERQRVMERIAAAAAYRVTAIIAPAGFGKSVAVRQFLRTVPSSVVYDVPADATTLPAFVRGFSEALHTAAPALLRSVSTALDGARKAEEPGRDLASWAAAHLRSLDTLIVIDDLHVGEGDPEISAFITALIERTKGGPRWLLSSRSPLQLPLATWLAYGESDLLIDAVDLRFTLEDAKRGARATRIAVREEELKAIVDLTGGWPVALTFALRTSTRASDLNAVASGTREMVYRYLAEQVWKTLDNRSREFLKTMIFLPSLDARFSDAAGFDDGASLLQSLLERVAFITRSDDGAYQLHDLFRDFVRHQVHLEGTAAVRAASLAAAKTLESVGLFGLALDRYTAVGAPEDAARILSTNNFRLLEAGYYDAVERALRALPSGPLLTEPRILALRAAIEEAYGRSDQAERWYAAILAAPVTDASFHVSVAWRYGLLLYQASRLDALPMLRDLDRRADLADADRAQIVGTLAMTLALAGDVAVAQEKIQEAFALAEFGDDELRARTYGRAATVAFFAADEAAVEKYSSEGSRLAAECGAYSLASRLYGALLSQHGAHGRVAATAWCAAQMTENAEKGGDPQMRALGLRVQSECEALRGNFDRFEQLELEHARVRYRGNHGFGALAIARGLAALGRGRADDALQHLASARDESLYANEVPTHRALYALAHALKGDREAALVALARYASIELPENVTTVFARSLARADRYVVLSNILLDRKVMAQRGLREAHGLDVELGYIDAALTALLNRSPEPFAASLTSLRLASLGGIAALLETASNTILSTEETAHASPLTAAESQVLAAMVRGLSNKAIAEEQRRTVNTVRAHVSSILRKLGCSSRGEAVAIARALTLL